MASPQDRHRLLAGLTRSRLLAILRQGDRPFAVRELAETVGLHPNSVREQLDQLVDAGLVARASASPAGRGRPGLRYVAVLDDGDPDPNAYRELARVLADELAQQPDPPAGATRAGERWGHELAAGEAPTPTAHEAVDRVLALLERSGFAPERPATVGDPIRLHHCPFGPLARERRDVVCGVHLGLMRGALQELGAPLDAIRLEPFVTPGLCVAHLGPRAGSSDG